MMISFLVVLATCLSVSHAEMVCSLKEENFISKLQKTCPSLLDSADLGYCCINTDGSFKCCDFVEFAALYLIIGAVILIILSIVISIICCFCCSCCFCYKRRHGTVVHVVHVPAHQQTQGHNAVAYTQQPPYNPGYP